VSDEPSFQDLIRRVRAGDQAAATELVRRYEPAIRRAVRFRLADARLGAVLDSMDICQSVLASFFLRTAAGQFEIDQPEQLLKLLVSMARNKLASLARRETAERRDRRRTVFAPQAAEHVAARGSGPGRQAAARELLREAYQRLTPEERQLAELRNQGLDWNTIASQLGGTAVGLRKKLSRALDRVTRQLRLDEEHDE
jgi:RNA polymerase sigma-70 factor (ECF subfamily)